MRLHFDIKPQRIVISNPGWVLTMNRHLAGINAVYKVSKKACYTVGSNGNIHWTAYTELDMNNQNVYAYNVEYYKRGKYKNKKEFVVYVYTFKMDVLKALGLSIEQLHHNFKLYKIDKHGKKIYL